MSNDDITSELVDGTNGDDVSNEESPAYQIAAYVMSEFAPGFVIIGSPILLSNDKGLTYPDSIGIVMNDKVGVTKTVLSEVLLHLSARLGEDMVKLETFLQEALNNDN